MSISKSTSIKVSKSKDENHVNVGQNCGTYGNEDGCDVGIDGDGDGGQNVGESGGTRRGFLITGRQTDGWTDKQTLIGECD